MPLAVPNQHWKGNNHADEMVKRDLERAKLSIDGTIRIQVFYRVCINKEIIMKFVWKCDRGHIVKKDKAKRVDSQFGDKRWTIYCSICKAEKLIFRQMSK